MLVPPVPVNRELVPPMQPAVPDAFTRVDSQITAGLPHVIPLTDTLTLTLVLPTGLATMWRDANPADVITSSDSSFAPYLSDSTSLIGRVGSSPSRLVLRRAGTTIGSVPLVAGQIHTLPDSGSGDRGVTIMVTVLSWSILTGSVRGPGDIGSCISIVWRPADKGTPLFSPPPISPSVVHRGNGARGLQVGDEQGTWWEGWNAEDTLW